MTTLFDEVTFAHGPAMANRFMLAPLTNQQSNEDGTLSEAEYRWLTMRAEGGFGLVYRGFHRELGLEVALKVLLPPPELTAAQLDEFVLNFAMEARTLERILHPNIVRVLDTGEAVMPSGHHTGFIALEWIEGVVLENA